MKLSLDSIGYGGYFTAPGESASLEESMRRAARFGYDAVCVYAHRPTASQWTSARTVASH
jgi:hypothetical protein